MGRGVERARALQKINKAGQRAGLPSRTFRPSARLATGTRQAGKRCQLFERLQEGDIAQTASHGTQADQLLAAFFLPRREPMRW
jgi:hypothetical protein